MHDQHLYEYAVIRVVPRMEREEFMNVGVIVYCSGLKFLKCMFRLNEERLNAFAANLPLTELNERLAAFEKICAAGPGSGPIGKLPVASRFRWLIAARSTIVQTSPVHPGLCLDAGETLINLYNQLVQ